MKSIISSLSWIGGITAVSTGFIYPPSAFSESPQNLTFNAFDTLIVAYTVDPSVEWLGISMFCDNAIKTDLVLAPLFTQKCKQFVFKDLKPITNNVANIRLS